MTPTETVAYVRYLKAVFPQQQFDEYTADAWCDVLGHLDLDEARHAAISIVWRQPFVSPSEIIAEVERKRREHPSSRTVAEAIGQSSRRELTAAPATPPTAEYLTAKADMDRKQREREQALYLADRKAQRRADDWLNYKLSGQLPPEAPPLDGPIPSQFVILPDDPPELRRHLARKQAEAAGGYPEDWPKEPAP